MTEELPAWEAAKADPDKYVAEQEEKLEEVRREMRAIRDRLRIGKRLQTCKADLDYLTEHGIPRPRTASAGPEDGDGLDDDDLEGHDAEGGMTDIGAELPRKAQVERLLGQRPEKRWRLDEIAELLGISNVKSLRTSLDEYARDGVIAKQIDNNERTYHALPGVERGQF
ncbi:hypothetical protein AB0M28_07050 [Streptomyces sp. NPDC051940]|uniref:hypothetical protein n=1 Tax=Streptomyces sp. NPDC051940 TaxID=3155675 RepID=UPI00344777BC